jgi:type II secretory pathway component GspD/PulD (secretin)
MTQLRVLITVCLLAEQFLAPVAMVFAQTTGNEKAFAQDLQGQASGEGGPMLEQAPGDNAPPQAMPQGTTPGSPIESVSIGGIPKEAPMYEDVESVSALDRKIGPIRLKGAPLSTFLDVVSAQSRVNFIISEDVGAKTITVFLRKTTVREALELLLRVKGLTYQRIGKSSTYVVQRRSTNMPNLITKIYVLNYIPLIRIGSPGEDMAAITAQDVSSSNQAGTGKKEGGEEGGVSIMSIIKSVLSKPVSKTGFPGGTLASDPRTNTLIITDVPEVFPQVEQIIAELDKKTPQILIEAQIVEINTDRLNELGIEWGGTNGEMAYFAGPARLTDYGLRPGFFSGDEWKNFFPQGVDTSASASDSGSAGGGGAIDPIFSTSKQSSRGVFYGVFSLAQLQALFKALISKGEARYLGKPKIVAMNNMMALMSVSRDAAMGESSQVVSAGGSTGSSSTGAERKRIGLALKVTPQVNKEGYITLVVQPSYSDMVPSAITTSGNKVYDPVTRGASTMVRVKNGQTVVIGGMLSSSENKTVRKVPLLGYIPIIGWLFTSVSSRRTNTDLVIFVTPTILVD